MDTNLYTLDMICDRCGHVYGTHFSTHGGIINGCVGSIPGGCPCALFLPTKEDQDRASMQGMLEEAASILREVMSEMYNAHPTYTRIGIALELVRDTLGTLAPS